MSAIFSNEVLADVPGPVPVTGDFLTDAQLRAAPVEVDGSGVTQPISAVSLPLPTGASTSALQTSGNASLTSIDGKTPALGQATMAASSPVVIASNQTAIPVSFSTAAGVPTVTRVAVSTTVATLAAADSTRKRLIVHNETGTLFVKLGAAATSTDYTYRLTANTMLDIDFSQTLAVTAIKAAGTSDAQVTSIV